MKPQFSLAGLILGSALILAPGCGREGPLSRDPVVATRQVGELVPRGTSEARARKALGDRGFALSRLSSDQANNHLIVATRASHDRMWQVGLIIVDAKVAATSVTVSDLSAPTK